jgi:arylsulfatase A-like enzyme
VLSLAFTFFFVFSASLQAQPTGRNILFIVVDDMRNWAGYTGDYEGAVHTPNIDALAAQSTRYLNAYATATHCLGSRTSVLMGMSPPSHGVGHTHNFFTYVGPVYDAIYDNPAVVSLPEVMTGYYTATTGKVFHYPEPSKWDESGPAPYVQYLYNIWLPGPDGTHLYAAEVGDTDLVPDMEIADWASSFVTAYDRPEPFFLSVGFNLPHQPWFVPAWAYNHYPQVFVEVPITGDMDDEPALAVELAAMPNFGPLSIFELVQNAGKSEEYTRAYLAGITHTDAMIGQVLAALANSPHADTTDIVFWSDNGFQLGEKEHWMKFTFWESSIRVPLLIKSPKYPPGDVTSPVSLLDLAPTVLDLAGVAANAQFEGVPLHDAGNRSPVEVFVGPGKATVDSAGLKLIDYDTSLAGLGDFAAYSLPLDPKELNNIASILDLDGDGVPSGVEISPGIGTDPFDADTDDDGLDDGEEINYAPGPDDIYSPGLDTNPLAADTDGDAHSDGDEVDAGYDPLLFASFPPAPGC